MDRTVSRGEPVEDQYQGPLQYFYEKDSNGYWFTVLGIECHLHPEERAYHSVLSNKLSSGGTQV